MGVSGCSRWSCRPHSQDSSSSRLAQSRALKLRQPASTIPAAHGPCRRRPDDARPAPRPGPVTPLTGPTTSPALSRASGSGRSPGREAPVGRAPGPRCQAPTSDSSVFTTTPVGCRCHPIHAAFTCLRKRLRRMARRHPSAATRAGLRRRPERTRRGCRGTCGPTRARRGPSSLAGAAWGWERSYHHDNVRELRRSRIEDRRTGARHGRACSVRFCTLEK